MKRPFPYFNLITMGPLRKQWAQLYGEITLHIEGFHAQDKDDVKIMLVHGKILPKIVFSLSHTGK